MNTKKLYAFGTYGFLSMVMAAQMAMADSVVDKADRGTVDAKKSARSVKRDMKKAGRNVRDEAAYHNRKIKRKAE